MTEGKTIVVVDDDLASVEVLVKFLRKAGHRVAYFYDGQAGWDAIRSQAPDLVVSDMLLPRLHGLDLCRRVKEDPELRRIPVVLMTGVYRDPRQKSEVTRVGADAFFTKPFDLGRTVNLLQGLLGEAALEVAPEEVREEIETVIRDYLAALPARLREVDLLLERLRRKGSREALAYLHLQVHALAGSSATFGFNQLSKWASAASVFLRNLLDAEEVPGEAAFEQIQTFLVEMRYNAPVPAQEDADGAIDGPSSDDRPEAPTLLPDITPEQRRLVYLVEPHLGLANELTLELELFGFKVVHFSDEAALNQARGDTPDALVMAFEMPEGQLIGVRAQPRYRAVPLILLAGDDGMPTRLAAVRVGGDAFMVKPLDGGDLSAKIHQMTRVGRTSPPRVLLVVGDRDEAEAMGRTLAQADMVVSCLHEPLAVMDHLRSFSPDMVVIDTDITGCSGVELVRLIHQDDGFLGLAVLMLTSDENPLVHEELLGEGVDDVLVKPVKPGTLVTRIAHRGKRFRGLRAQMVHDGLTGLLNATTLMHGLGVELERVRRRAGCLAVAVIDLDQLGRLNEMMGHLAGNRAIRGLAGMLSRRLRHSDLVGRFEGPSVLVLLPDTTSEQAEAVLRHIVADFAHVLQHVEGHDFYATVSCGIAGYPRFKDSVALIEGARAGLRKAKQLGGNRVVRMG